MKDLFTLSFKNLKRRGIRSWLTLLGVFIGIAAVVSLITLGSGLKLAVTSQFGISSTEIISVQAGGLSAFGPPGSGVTNPLTRDDLEEIKKIAGVESAVPRNIETIKVDYNDFLIFTSAISMSNDIDELALIHEILDIKAQQGGRLLDNSDSNKVVLGYDFSVETKSGFDKAVEVGDQIDVQGKSFTVVGVLERKGSFIFDNIILMMDDDLEALTGYGDDIDVIGVKVKDKDLIDKVSTDIEELLRDRRDVKEGEEDFEVSTPEQTLETVNQVLSGVQIFVVIIAFMSIIVGALGIVNTMTTSVLERRKEIGIMKAIGAKNKDIFMQFLFEAGLLGLIGGILGVLLGILIGYFSVLALNNFLGAATTPEIDVLLISLSLLGSFIIGAASGIAPAMQAARQKPVDALRG